MVPHYFFIGILFYFFIKEIREWTELAISYAEDNKEPEPIPENVKHIYS